MHSIDAAEIARLRSLIKDLFRPQLWRFWLDLTASAFVGWVSLGAAMVISGVPSVLASVVAIFVLWRAVQFIHELAHLSRSKARGLHAMWNVWVGVPFCLPLFMFDTHLLHHRTDTFGTSNDPEYVPISEKGYGFWVLFMAEGFTAPLLLWIRFAVLTPLSWFFPPLRRWLLRRASTLGINHKFVRKDLLERPRGSWQIWETTTALWAVSCLIAVASGLVSVRTALVWIAISTAVGALDQAKTLVVHRFQVSDDASTLGAQVLDGVNVEGNVWTELWAPLGNRYHALHHLFPALPYHSMARAHARLKRALPASHVYHLTIEPSFVSCLRSMSRAQAARNKTAPQTA